MEYMELGTVFTIVCKPKTFKSNFFFFKEKHSSGREMAFEEVN